MTLDVYLRRATREGWAVPHFNVATSAQMHAIALAARDTGSPVMIGTSEKEAEHLGWAMVPLMVAELSRMYSVPLFANADHMKSLASAEHARDAGFASIICDLSKLPEEENVRATASFVTATHATHPHINIEGEYGVIVTDSSKVYTEVVTVPRESLTKPEEARTFVAMTGVNRFAAAVGTIHGIAANKPILDIDRIRAIREVLPEDVAMVLHGGSGLSNEDFVAGVRAGIANVHVSTSLRVVYREALEKSLKDNPHEVAPYAYEKGAIEAMRKEAARLIGLFGAGGKA